MASLIDDILTPTEAAALAKVSVKTVYRAIRSGALIASQVGRGRLYRITRANFGRWMDDTVVELAPRIATRAAAGTPAAGSDAALRAIEQDAA